MVEWFGLHIMHYSGGQLSQPTQTGTKIKTKCKKTTVQASMILTRDPNPSNSE